MYNIKELRAEVKRLQKEIDSKLKDAFKETSDILFRNHPKLESFSWTQYTPYFNDGEECVFGAHNNYPTIALIGRSEPIEDVSKWLLEKKEISKYLDIPLTEEEEETLKAVLDFTTEFDDSELKTMFGDHVTVFVTKYGVTTNNFDHD